ncbi:hypothetical protein RUM43_000728 [Polyplax serrata]|uniref:Uncharacterized protein n=1 Tax=Polyplax serrata TaxID=468196 RepID=A0AAN8SGR6_POLSC
MSASLGNIMDDNVGFSYAELVRQDDNAFGVPDFMEETKPCNHLVLHRHKKSSRPEKNFWATRNSDQLTKENGMYQRGNNKALLDISDLQLLQKKLLELSQSQSTEQRQGLKQKNENTIEFKKKTYKEPFEIRSKCNDMERTKILNVLLKDIRNLKPINKQGCVGESSNINPECSLQDGGITVKRKIKNKMGSKVDEFRESKFGGKVQSKGKDGAIKYKVHKIMTLQMHPPEATYPQDQSTSDSFNLTQTLGEKLMIPNTLLTHDLKVNKDDNPVSRERDHDFLLSSNRFFNEKKNAKSDSNDLMAEAQLAMKGAEQVLKNFTLPRAESEKLSSCVPPEMGEYRYPNRKYEFLPLIATNTQKNDETSRRHVFSFIRGKYPVQVEKGEAYLGKNLMNKQLNMRHRGNELDVLNVISLGDSSRSSLNRRDLPSDQHRVDERNPPTEYVMIIGKLTDSGGEYRKNKENVKKSYREYHYNVRTPVVYNSVVIASGGKPERTDDSRDFYNEYSSREFKKKLDEFEGERSDKTKRSDEGKETLEEELSGERGHFHSKSVRNTQNNIKNIYQYVGLSLPFMSRTPFSFLCLISIYSISRYTYLGVFDVVKMFSLVMEPPVLEANFSLDF